MLIMKRILSSICVFAACVCAYAQSTAPDGFRGPRHDGQYLSETGLMKTWPAEGPAKLWENLQVGDGYSSPVIDGDRIYITGLSEDKRQEVLTALDKNGKALYTVAYGSPWRNSYPETRTTPTIYKGKAYVISGSGEVVCLNAADGKVVWKVDGNSTYRTTTGNWGTAESPLIVDNKVIYSPGGNQTSLVALDADTGKEIWKSRSLGEKRAYATPILIEWKGKKQIVAFTMHSIFGADPSNGNIEWKFSDWGDKGDDNIPPNSPLFKDGRIFFSQGYDIGSFMLQLNDNLNGVTLVWKNSDMDTHHGGYVLVDGVIYGTNWVNNNSGNWLALDWNTGKTLYNTAWSGGKGKGSIIYADGMLYCYDERRGYIGMVKPDGKAFKTVSEFRMDKGTGPNWAHLVISDGILYARHGTALIAYKIK